MRVIPESLDFQRGWLFDILPHMEGKERSQLWILTLDVTEYVKVFGIQTVALL